MGNPSSLNDLKNDLERAKSVMKTIMEKLSDISERLQDIELETRISQSEIQGNYTFGSPYFIICLPVITTNDKHIVDAISELVNQDTIGLSIILVRDEKESKETCRRVINIIKGHIQNHGENLLIAYLKNNFIPNHLQDGTVILGKRFQLNTDMIFQKIKEFGFNILQDNGEFGGGRLIYHIIKELEIYDSCRVCEITIPKSISKDKQKLMKLLESLSSVVQ